MILNNPKIVVNYLGANLESYSFDQESFKFPFSAHVNSAESMSKLIKVTLYDEDIEIGTMKLKMQTLMMMGAKQSQLLNSESIKEAVRQRKSNWFPIFKNR